MDFLYYIRGKIGLDVSQRPANMLRNSAKQQDDGAFFGTNEYETSVLHIHQVRIISDRHAFVHDASSFVRVALRRGKEFPKNRSGAGLSL